MDVFIRRQYFEIVVKSLNYCVKEKGMLIYSWCIMPSHLHLVFQSSNDTPQRLLQDFKKHTTKQLIHAIKYNSQESRREWLLCRFEKAGKKQAAHISFGNTTIIQLSSGVM
jgi:REP element-mobilizing transposase RayT